MFLPEVLNIVSPILSIIRLISVVLIYLKRQV